MRPLRNSLQCLHHGRTALRAQSTLAQTLHRRLVPRKLPLSYDYLHPQPSHLLNLSLADLLPGLCAGTDSTTLPSIAERRPMPVGHHLVYFPPQLPLSQLLPDGTDTLHTPGPPFNRRLWAGGSVRFGSLGPLLDGSRAVCIETIRRVVPKGVEGEEKVMVRIERRVGTVDEDEDGEAIRRRIFRDVEDEPGQADVIENRELVFMREKTPEQLHHDQEHFGQDRSVKPPSRPVFRHSLTPTRALLFRFSALTFNAHSIHLDKLYTQDKEGYMDLLVHGPLTLTLLLTVVQAHLSKSAQTIMEVDYKNLAPLYVDEELAVCGRPKGDTDTGIWDVWIEGGNGGLAVRGTVRTDDAV